MSYPVPANEEERLRHLLALRLGDSRPHAELQALCELVARVYRVPIVLVTLVGRTEHMFAAKVGFDGICRAPREMSFCAHAIMGDTMLTVDDATRDARFADSPLVTGPTGIRAYAGTPLAVAPGVNVGVLCIADTLPRRFTAEERADLDVLALVVRRILIAHRENLDLLDALELVSRQRTELESRTRALEYAAAHCGMTGLLNAASFRSRATAMARLPQSACAFALIDIDNFKQINDSHGHRFGDSYLETVARALRGCLPAGALAGRMGGDEFGLLLRGPDAVARISDVVAQLREALDAEAVRLDVPVAATLSIGVVSGVGGSRSFEDLYQDADAAMYAAKRQGRNRTVWHTADAGSGAGVLAAGAG